MSVRQKKTDRHRKQRDGRSSALRLYGHYIWEVLHIPYVIACPKGHRLGRGSEPFVGEVACKKCKKTYSGTYGSRLPV